MLEKNLEFSDLNSNLNSEQRFSFSQSQRYQTATFNTEGDALFNLSENPSSIFKSTRQQTIYFKHNHKNKEKKIKCYFLYKNMKKIKGCLKSILKNLYFILGKNIRVQVCLTYSVFVILMIIIILLINYLFILNNIKLIADKNYFLFYVNNIINSQREIKVQLDEINNHDTVASGSDPLLFLRIYTEEMVSYGILENKTLVLKKNLGDMYADLGENFILSKDLNELAEIYEDSESTDEPKISHNINNLLPFYYHFSPILIESLNTCGIKLKNIFFIANEVNFQVNKQEQKINSMYFKYPLDNLDLAPDVPQENNKIFDFILDPYIDSTFDYKDQSEIIGSIKHNNWFYNCLQNADTHFRMIKIDKISEKKTRKDYLMIYSRSENLTFLDEESDDTKIFFTFSMKVNLDEEDFSFIEFSKNNDILNFDYLSIYNFVENFNQINIQNSNIEKNFEIDYDLDAGRNILIKIPKFISNIHTYSMLEKNKPLNEDQSKLLKYDEMKEIDKIYETNYYFKKDALIFKLIYFLNEFFEFKKKHSDYLTEQYDSKRTIEETSSDHPCIFQGTDEYYEKIKTEYDYDCLDDYCLYNNCDQAANNLEDLYFMPNCYCIPLFCRDSRSPMTHFHDKLKERILNLNSSMSENAYSFTSTYKDYLMKKEYNFSQIDQYFDRQNFIFNCKLSFGQKNNSYNKFFKTKIKLQNISYKFGDKNFLMFFMNNNMTSFIVNNLKSLNFLFFSYIYSGYFIFLICTIEFLIKYILLQVNNLLNRMEKIKKIRTTLITNEEEKNDLERISHNNDSNLNESMINLNEDNLSEKSHDSLNKNTKKEKKKKKEEKVPVEMDELDTLIKLINGNLADFQIKFNLNEDMNSNINEIKKQYNGIIKINQYKNKLLNNKANEINSFEDEEESISETNEKEKNFDNLSLKMFYELLSTSTTEMDFSNIKRNFYYRKHDGKLLFGLDEILPYFNEEDSNGTGEITNLSKIQNAIYYYYRNIHKVWEKQYEDMKREEELK